MSSTEECEKGMEQRSDYAAVKDALIKLSEEGCVQDMGQRGYYVEVKDVRILLREEECARGMGHRGNEYSKQYVLNNET